MSDWAKSIYAVTLFAEDLAATKSFYETVFGAPAVFENEDSAVFKVGEVLINLLAIENAPELVEPAKVAQKAGGVRHVFTVHVDDVDAMCHELARRGVTLVNGPMDRPWGIRSASFADPAGHIWEIAT